MTWRLAVRIARREAWRTRGRSLLVASMIALPVAGASAADTLWRSTQVSVAEQATRTMGQYDALVGTFPGGPLWQSPDGSERTPDTDTSPGSAPAASTTPASLGNFLPPGSKSIAFSGFSGQVSITKGAGRVWARAMERDLTDPLQAGMTRKRSGRPPTADDEVAVSTSELASLGKKIGDTIEVRMPVADAPPAKTLRITGVYDLPDDLRGNLLFARPHVFSIGPSAYWLVSVSGGVSWDQVKQLNAHGFTVQSRRVLLHPPADSDVPLYTHSGYQSDSGGSGKAAAFAVAAIAVSMVLLEIILLAGPAFAVGARRRRRDFGLLGAAGADGKRVRRIVLADGLVLGAVGGTLGIAVGVLGSAAGYPWLSDLSSSEPGGFRVVPAELLAAGVVGVVTGLIAALAPAITTSRQDVLQALTGRRGASGTPWKMPVVGLVGIGLGTALVFYGAFRPEPSSLPTIAGIAVAELGVVACTPVLVAWSGRLARFLPLSGRLALRDGARNRGRTAPAVAAIMAAVAGASAVAMILSTSDAKSRAQYSTELQSGEAGIDLSGIAQLTDGSVDVRTVADRVGAQLPTRLTAVQYYPAFKNSDMFPMIERTAANRCPYEPRTPAEYHAVQAALRADRRCVTSQSQVTHHLDMNDITAGGPELLQALTGTGNPAAEAVLRQGGVVVFDPLDLASPAPHATVTITGRHTAHQVTIDGKTVICDMDPDPNVLAPDCPAETVPTVTLPAVVMPAPAQGGRAIVAPDGLKRLGVELQPMNLLVATSRMPTADEEEKADSAAAALGVEEALYVERGYQGGTTIGLLALAAVAGVVTLGAAAVATGLAITDAQNDLETLAAVGARPRVRRMLAGSQASVTAGLGAVLGAAFGLLPAIGLIETQTHSQVVPGSFGEQATASPTYLTVPWVFLGIVIVAVPALAAVGAAALTRSRIEMRRRRA